ncbi:MAG: NfeD family protein [Phycisphaerae bacterium]|nr:NfeD family protein [Phycisphaerae bacterium]
MNWWIAFAVFLYLVSALLLVAEVFIPSGGIISILSLGSLVGGLAIFWKHSYAAGGIGIIVALVMIPTVLIISYRVLPKTKFGRAVILQPPKRDTGDAIADTVKLKEMFGKQGVVITPLRPVGMCDFFGERIECVAENGYVDKGERVEVIRVESTQLTVRVI